MLPAQFYQQGFFSWVPSLCVACQCWPSNGLCQKCYKVFLSHQVVRCRSCGLELPASHLELCGHCLKQPFAFTYTVTAVSYLSPWSDLVQKLKFYRGTDYASLIAQLMSFVIHVRYKQNMQHYPELIIPVAMGDGRLRERGYNQAWEIARRLAKRVDIPADAHVLKRLYEQNSQTSRKRSERFKALKNAFGVPLSNRIKILQKHVVLVDDVMTTGATLHSAAIALKKAGAAQVSVWVFARTPQERVKR